MTDRRQITRFEQSTPVRPRVRVGVLGAVSPGIAALVAVFLVGAFVGLLFMALFLLVAILLAVAGFAFLFARRKLFRPTSVSHLRRYGDE